MIHRYDAVNIIAMDETSVWAYMVFATTVDGTGKKNVTVKTTGRETGNWTLFRFAYQQKQMVQSCHLLLFSRETNEKLLH